MTKTQHEAGLRWLTSVILTTQQAENRRIALESQLERKQFETLCLKDSPQKWAGRVAQSVDPEFKP
jgi:hypothetical protein